MDFIQARQWAGHGDAGPDPELIDVPLSDPRCNSVQCPAYAAARNASRTTTSRDSQIEYGKYTAYVYIPLLLLFAFIYVERLATYRHHESSRPRTTLRQKAEAAIRYGVYRRLPVLNMSLGVLAFLGVGLVVTLVMVLAEKPYYREKIGFGSPPIAVRTGMMSAALTPLLMAMGGKWNLVSFMTGYSYERLNVYHRYISYLAFILAMFHTFPFVVGCLRDGGTAEFERRFNREGSLYYSGVPPLAILFFLCVFSNRILRQKAYEFFVLPHILAAVTYLGLLFWHVPSSQWPWLWATVTMWLLQMLARLTLKNRFAVAKLESIDGEMLRVTLDSKKTWNPSQHVFLRFPRLFVWQNHPFTIASSCGNGKEEVVVETTTTMTGTGQGGVLTPATTNNSTAGLKKGDKRKKGSEMMFLIHPYQGITKRLHRMAQDSPGCTIPVIVDGPYGGHNEDFCNRFESVVLMAGGSGIGGVLSLFETLGADAGREGKKLQHLELVWVVVAREHNAWVGDTLQNVRRHAAGGAVGVSIYVARESGMGTPIDVEAGREGGGSSSEEKGIVRMDGDAMVRDGHAVRRNKDGSPKLGDLIPGMLKGKRNCIVVCGPDTMLRDAGDAVANCQDKVLRGELQEVALRSQVFGW